MKKIILAVSGRKQSGKSSTCRHIERSRGRDDVLVQEFSFADPLKDMCVKLLGLKPEQVRGTDEQKNSIVPHLLWENFPVWRARIAWCRGWLGFSIPYLRKGPMTGREVMQYWGTEVFRKAYHDVWAKAAVDAVHDWCREARSKQDHWNTPDAVVAVLPDCRFPNEVQAVKDAGGHVLRLTRDPFPDDDHPSEVALDADGYDWSNFDLVFDNASMTVDEQCEALTPWLSEIGAIG